MDEVAAAFTEDAAERRLHSKDDTSQIYIKTTDTADSKYLNIFATSCEESECSDTPMLTILASACFATTISPVCPPTRLNVYCGHAIFSVHIFWINYLYLTN